MSCTAVTTGVAGYPVISGASIAIAPRQQTSSASSASMTAATTAARRHGDSGGRERLRRQPLRAAINALGGADGDRERQIDDAAIPGATAGRRHRPLTTTAVASA